MKDAAQGNVYAIKQVEKAPKLEGPMVFYWNAFNDLGSERINGMGNIGQIPRSKIKQYAIEDLELSPRETEAFIHIVRRADVHYLSLQAQKAEARSKKH